MTNIKSINHSEINKHLIFGIIFFILLIVSSYILLKYLIPIGIIGVIIPLIGFIFHFNNAFKEGFIIQILSIKIDNLVKFISYISFNIIISLLIGLFIAFITDFRFL